MTDIQTWRTHLLQMVKIAGLLQQSRYLEFQDGTQGLIGRLQLESRSVELRIDVTPLWFHHLPNIYLYPPDALGIIPHIMTDGKICFLEDEGIIFDWRRPLEVIKTCLFHARRTLNEGLAGTNQHDFINEFEVYWNQLEEPICALANLDMPNPDQVAEVFVASSPSSPNCLYITRDPATIPHISHMVHKSGPWNAQFALYLPLDEDHNLLPPQLDKPFWGNDGVWRLFSHCSREKREQLEMLLRKRNNSHQYLVVRLPRPEGDAIYIGFSFEKLSDQHPLVNRESAQAFKPISIFRRDRNFMLQRGGGNPSLADKPVLLIGCGAVGGHIAFELSRAGVEYLDLIDKDTLQEENTYRHVLGQAYWNKNKAEALQQAIRSQLPYSKAKAHAHTIEEAVTIKGLDLCNYDLIISATGNPTSELALNEQVRSQESGPPIIFTWVDPYGIGGHALLTGIEGSRGCFECLYTSTDVSETLANRASFAAPNQVFRRSLASCTSLYTPYSSLDAGQTAHLATRLSLDVLTGRAHANKICSWKGDATEFLNQQFMLSSRYNLGLDELEQQGANFAHNDCRICKDQ